MVQRADFAYDDEELPMDWAVVGTRFPFENQDDEQDDDQELLDLSDLEQLELSSSPEMSGPYQGGSWPREAVRDEPKRPGHWPLDSPCEKGADINYGKTR